MKNIILICALAVGLVSCKKDNMFEGNNVVYTVECDSCVLIADMLNHPQRREEVKGFYQRSEVNSLDSIRVQTIGVGRIKSSIKINGALLRVEDNVQDGNTISYTVKP